MVSIIIPVYNGARFLKTCLESVVCQIYTDLEILVIDDGSIDNSAEICKGFAAKDSRIRLIQQKNSGVSSARNRGIKEATGEYIAFVDADDTLPQSAIALLMNAVDAETDLVVGSYETQRFSITKKVQFSAEIYDIPRIHKESLSFDRFINTPWAKLYKRSIIVKNQIVFDESLKYGEDHLFNFEYCKYVSQAKIIDAIVYKYRLGGMASSVKYYPDMNAICYKLLEGYKSLYTGAATIPQELLCGKIRDEFIASVMHYIAHCSYKETVNKTQETMILFNAYLSEETVTTEYYSENLAKSILSRNAKKIVVILAKCNIKNIILKKIKYFIKNL